jgi:hypothetical protein
MNNTGTAIPSSWLLIVPIASIIWLWKYAVAVETFTAAFIQKLLQCGGDLAGVRCM